MGGRVGKLSRQGRRLPYLIAALLVPACTCRPSGDGTPTERLAQNSGRLAQSAAVFSSEAVSLPKKVKDIAAGFVDCAAELGIQFTYYNDEVKDRFFLPEVMGGGVAWLDYDADGVLDLYACNGCQLRPPEGEAGDHRNRLFRGMPSDGRYRFQDVTDAGRRGG
ncbi:MAG: hypothetical protein KatS3mg110_4661 [Pirellulaceae bacterium]|nr:MAG: hypothetical protein KatS3mg110_4661 [Pirellulaceae bacterium]